MTDRVAIAAAHGFIWDGDGAPPFRAKPGSHDDGRYGGPFLGGIGAPAFSRNVLGQFDRWHLEPGVHAVQPIDACFLAVTWERNGAREGRRLAIGDRGFAPGERHYASLFPVTHEVFGAPLPFALTLETWSATIPGDLDAATLPVTLFDVRVDAVMPGVTHIVVALFWANLLGWTQFAQSSEHRVGQLWPAHTNAGNHAVAIDLDRTGTAAVAMRREVADAGDLYAAAETVIAVEGAGAVSRETCFLADVATTGVPAHEQRFTAARAEHLFLTTGALPQEERAWRAHWHEPQGSAVAADLSPRDGARARFVLVNDWPDCRFGAGRRWGRAYAENRPGGEHGGAALAKRALAEADAWRARIAVWQDDALARFAAAGVPPRVAGAALNELSFVTGGGSTWVASAEPVEGADVPLAATRHFGLLEGLDTGYFYYNTSDLWVYAFAAIDRHWPELSASVFGDYLDTIASGVAAERPTYRYGEVAAVLAPGKLPHDLGSPGDDPWVRLNGYMLRDDPNLWKDHNPAFVLSYLLHAQTTGTAVTDAAWQALVAAADFTRAQIRGEVGVPAHEEFGDSTWDNLEMRGVSSYTAALCLAMWAALAREAGARGQADTARRYSGLAAQARATLSGLWNGAYFLANDRGKYGHAIMGDALWGLFYARRLGLGDLIDPDRVRGHLLAAYEHSFRAYAGGRVGPLLVSAPGRQTFAHDGGQSLQVNEVIVGAGWMYAAMLREWDRAAESDAVAGALVDTLYGGSGLQFRTPAAWTADGRFRAPLNMRPLAVWLMAGG